MKNYKGQTTYFLTEGKANLQECLKRSFKHALDAGIRHIIVFTGNGEGLELACRKYLKIDEYKGIQLIGVSFPIGHAPSEALQISEERAKLFEKHNIPVIRAAFPFDDPPTAPRRKSVIHKTLDFFSGGMALCLNAVVVACDAGSIGPGQHVIVMSADTSLLVKASPSSHAFSSLAVREIICKPLIQDITKGEKLAAEVNVDALLQPKRRRSTKVLSAPVGGEQKHLTQGEHDK